MAQKTERIITAVIIGGIFIFGCFCGRQSAGDKDIERLSEEVAALARQTVYVADKRRIDDSLYYVWQDSSHTREMFKHWYTKVLNKLDQ